MTIISLVATLLGLIWWAWRRYAAKKDALDPNLQRKEKADEAIAKGASGVNSVNDQLDDLLRRLPPVPKEGSSNSSGQGSDFP